MADAGTTTKTCPDCAEEVLTEAKVCKHCGHRFDRDVEALARIGREQIVGVTIAIIVLIAVGIWLLWFT